MTNLIQISTMSSNTPAVARKNGAPQSCDWAGKETVSATLTQITNGTAFFMTQDDFTFTASASDIKGSVGETLNFRVIKKDENQVTLKQVFENSHYIQNSLKPNESNPDEIKNHIKSLQKFSDENKEITKTKEDEHRKTAQALAKIKRMQSSINGNASKSAIRAIVSSGLSLTKISFTALHKVMIETEKKTDTKTAASADDLQALLPQDTADNEIAASIVKSLLQEGLPVHEQNISAMKRVLQVELSRIDDAVMVKMIKEGLPVTPENVYVSRHSSLPKDPRDPLLMSNSSGDAWDDSRIAELLPEVQKLFARENIADTKENRNAAAFLLCNDLPLDRENINKVLLLWNAQSGTSVDSLLAQAAAAISRGEDPFAMEINSGNVSREMNSVAEQRRNAEIQFKSTSESAVRLADKDIQIDTNPIKETVERLRNMESESHARMLRAAGASASAENVAQMDRLFSTLSDISPLTANVHAGIISQQVRFTIGGIWESVSAAQMLEHYDAHATVPNPRYGDSFRQVRGQFEPLLTSLDITPTAENIKAGFILTRNNMDINIENINAVKAVDMKISAIVSGLHPMIAANMIKDGLQPLETHVDQLLSYMDGFKDALGHNGGDKAAQYIMEMDKDKVLDASTRESMIAVYRMLNIIQKNDAAALGLVLQQDTPLTLGSLMEAAKYFDRRRNRTSTFDYTVDDASGPRDTQQIEGNIRNILEGAAREHGMYAKLLSESFTDRANPGNLQRAMQSNPRIMREPLEDLIHSDEMDANPANENNSNYAAAQVMDQFLNASPAMIHFLQSNNITVTAGALQALRRLTNKAGEQSPSPFISLNDADDETKEAISEALPDTNLQSLVEGQTPDGLLNQLMGILGDELTAARHTDRINHIKTAQELINLQRQLNRDDDFCIPLRYGDKIGNLSVFVLNEKALSEPDARVYITLGTDSLGTVSGYITLGTDSIDLRLCAETPEAAARIDGNKDWLTNMFKQIGFETVECEVAHERAVLRNSLNHREIH